MNPVDLQRRILRLTCALVAACSIFLSACGGSSSSTDTAGIGGTGIGVGGTGIVFGKITGFGSVLVNGGTYDIDTSQFNVDGNTSANQSDLALGMVIQLQVETSNGVFTDKAVEVVYDDEIEGPVTNLMTPNPLEPTIKTGIIFGQTITFDDTSTVFDNTSFAGMVNGNVIEVSGFRVSPTQINATYVEKKFDNVTLGSTEVELRGIIGSYMAGPPETFVLDGVTVNTDAFTEVEVSGSLQDGIYVEAKGIIQSVNSMLATKIEEEEEDFDEDVDDISLQGVISGFTDITSNFLIDNQLVNAGTAQLDPASLMLADGLNVEVEGEIVGGLLIADEVELREGETKLRSEISAIDTINGEFFKVIYPVAVPNEVTVRIDGQTLFEDDTGPLVTSPFSLDDLRPMDFVRIEGQEIVNNEVLATVVKRTSPDDELKLEGLVDAYAPGSSIRVLGVEYGLDTNTDYEPDPPDITVGDFVEIEDKNELPGNPADGVADEVEEE